MDHLKSRPAVFDWYRTYLRGTVVRISTWWLKKYCLSLWTLRTRANASLSRGGYLSSASMRVWLKKYIGKWNLFSVRTKTTLSVDSRASKYMKSFSRGSILTRFGDLISTPWVLRRRPDFAGSKKIYLFFIISKNGLNSSPVLEMNLFKAAKHLISLHTSFTLRGGFISRITLIFMGSP